MHLFWFLGKRGKSAPKSRLGLGDPFTDQGGRFPKWPASVCLFPPPKKLPSNPLGQLFGRRKGQKGCGLEDIEPVLLSICPCPFSPYIPNPKSQKWPPPVSLPTNVVQRQNIYSAHIWSQIQSPAPQERMQRNPFLIALDSCCQSVLTIPNP